MALGICVGGTDHLPYWFWHIDGMTNLEAMGKRIRELRRLAHMTQDQLAAELGISRSTLAGVELGKDRLGIESTIATADYFKVPMDWLIGRRVPAGGPLSAQFFEDGDELGLVKYWRSLPLEKRRAMAAMLDFPTSDRNVA